MLCFEKIGNFAFLIEKGIVEKIMELQKISEKIIIV